MTSVTVPWKVTLAGHRARYRGDLTNAQWEQLWSVLPHPTPKLGWQAHSPHGAPSTAPHGCSGREHPSVTCLNAPDSGTPSPAGPAAGSRPSSGTTSLRRRKPGPVPSGRRVWKLTSSAAPLSEKRSPFPDQAFDRFHGDFGTKVHVWANRHSYPLSFVLAAVHWQSVTLTPLVDRGTLRLKQFGLVAPAVRHWRPTAPPCLPSRPS